MTSLSLSKWLKYFVVSMALAIGVILLWTLVLFLSLPKVPKLAACPKAKITGVMICAANADYERLPNISPFATHAIQVSEDAGFFGHEGFDWFEFWESFKVNIARFSYVRGASTITQQVAKNVFLSGEKSLSRKVQEAMLAHSIEEEWSKQKILEVYLNVIEFGSNLYGIGPASWHYFGRPASQINVLQGAYLAYLLPNPKAYSATFKNKQLTPYAIKRIRVLLGRLKHYGRISSSEYQVAINNISYFPWRHLPKKLSDGALKNPSLKILSDEAEGISSMEDLSETSHLGLDDENFDQGESSTENSLEEDDSINDDVEEPFGEDSGHIDEGDQEELGEGTEQESEEDLSY